MIDWEEKKKVLFAAAKKRGYYGGRKQDIEDLIQRTFIKFLESNYEEQGKLDGFLFLIMKNQYVNDYRRTKKLNEILSTNAAPLIDRDRFINPEDYLIDQRLEPRTEYALSTLSKRWQKIVLMVADGATYSEVSRRLKIPEGSVMSGMFRAREKFVRAYNNYEEAQ